MTFTATSRQLFSRLKSRVMAQTERLRLSQPDPNIISSFAWISQFTALAVSDCQARGREPGALKVI
ncbi:unnamed protein product [Symbiodinium sp. CCMP2456]|nr:unnamed protein product [Symbiodinium sp. CCMP2456]